MAELIELHGCALQLVLDASHAPGVLHMVLNSGNRAQDRFVQLDSACTEHSAWHHHRGCKTHQQPMGGFVNIHYSC